MKKFLSFIFLLCLFVPCSFMLTACGEDDTNNIVSLKILLNGKKLSLYECVWDNILGNEEVFYKDDLAILKVYEDQTEIPVELKNCEVSFKKGSENLPSLNFWESGETELTPPGRYTITIASNGFSANFDVIINKMSRTYGDVSLINGTDTLGYGGFDNTYTIDWNYNQYKNLSLSGACESEPYGEDIAETTHYFVDKTGYDNAEDKSAYYQSNKTLCYPDFTTMPIGTYYIFAEFGETTYYNAGISTSPLCLTLNARSFEPTKTTLDVEFDINNLISNNKLVKNAESVNIQYVNIEEKINDLFPQFENYGITAFEKLSYCVYENHTWKQIQSASLDIKVNAVNIGDLYYLVKYDFENQKWLRVSTSSEVDENYIEVISYTQLQEYQTSKFIEIPLYCRFNSQNLSNDFYYCTNVDKIFTLNLTIQKAQINSIDEDLGTFIIEQIGYDVKPDIINAIDNIMIAKNNENVKYLYTYPNSLDGLIVGSYSTNVTLINNPNICWNISRNFNFNVQNKDIINPRISIVNYSSYDRNIEVDFAKMINMSLFFDYDTNELTIEIIENDTTIKTFIYQLSFTDKETYNSAYTTLNNKTFEYEVVGENIIGSSDYSTIKDVGTTTIIFNIYDSFNNKGTTELEFKFYNSNTNLEQDYCELDQTTPILNQNKEIIGYSKNLIKQYLVQSSEKYELPVVYAKKYGEELSIDSITGKVTNEKATIVVTKNGKIQTLNATNSDFTSQDNKFYITPNELGYYTIEYIFTNSANRPTATYTITVLEEFEPINLKLASVPEMPTIELGMKNITLPQLIVKNDYENNIDVNIKSITIEHETNSSIKYVLENNNCVFDMTLQNFNAETYSDMKGNYRITYIVEDAYNKTLTETFKVDNVTISTKPTIKLSYDFDTTQSNFKEIVKFGVETELRSEYDVNSNFLLPAVYVEDPVTINYSDFIIIRRIRKGSAYYYIDNIRYDYDLDRLIEITSNEKGYNASGDVNIGKTNKAVAFKFNENVTNNIGTYYLEYEVITKQVVKRENALYIDGTSSKYTFKVLESTDLTDYENPTIEITNLKNCLVKNTEKITVQVESFDSFDSYVKNSIFTYSSAKDGTNATLEYYITLAIQSVLNLNDYELTSHIFENAKFIEKMNEYYNDFEVVCESETKNWFKLDLTNKIGTLNVVAVAINDNGKIGIDTRILTVEDASDDISPVVKVYYDELPAHWKDSNEIDGIKTNLVVGQGETVYLPTLYVIDNNTKLTLNIKYYINTPTNSYGGTHYYAPSNRNFYYKTIEIDGQNQEVQMMDGGYITTTKTGIYYVLYTATDVGDNITIKYFTFEVYDTSSPILSVVPIGEDITITGNTITALIGTIIDFEITLRSSDGQNDYTSVGNIEITISDNGKGLDFQQNGNTSYIFNDLGTYIITISGNYNGRYADNKIIRVIVEKSDLQWLDSFDEIPNHANRGETLKLPDIKANNGAVVTVKIVGPGSNEGEAVAAVKKIDANGYAYWEFTTSATSKGTYTVIYTATTDKDTLVQKLSIKVGDNVAPTLSFNKGELTQNLIYDGEHDIEYVVEMNKSQKTFVVKVINNGKEVYSYNIGLTISDKDDTGSVNTNMSWSNLSFELTGDHVITGNITSNSTQYLISGTGNYSLKLTIKDSYDNSRTETIDFNVVAKLEQEEDRIEEIKSCKGYIVSTNGTGKFNVEDLNIMPGTYLEYTLINSCKVDGILCQTTSNIMMTNNIIQIEDGVDNAYVILKVTKPGNETYKDYSQFIQIKIYR